MSNPSQVDVDPEAEEIEELEEEPTEEIHIGDLEVAAPTVEKTYIYEGVTVRFPYAAYECQEEMMQEIIKGVQNSQNCLLESPTGTGKTASLLCSLLAWQQKYIEDNEAQESKNDTSPTKNLNSSSTSDKIQNPNPDEEMEEELENSDKSSQNSTPPSTCTVEKQILEKEGEPESENVQAKKKKPKLPKIYYATRTHTQIKAVVSQLKNTAYAHVPMTILGSREQFCINPEARKKAEDSTSASKKVKASPGDIINKFCEDLRALAVKENKESGSPGFGYSSNCSYHKSSHKSHFVQLAKEKGAVDIEDLVSFGKEHKKCPYYGSKDLMDSAKIIFCTYNHLLQRSVRAACGVKFENSVFVFDEAHNIEGFCSSQGSFEVSLDKVDEVKQILEEADQRTDIPKSKQQALKTLKIAFINLSKWLRSQSTTNEKLKFKMLGEDRNYVGEGKMIKFKRDLNELNFAKFGQRPSWTLNKRARLATETGEEEGEEEITSFPKMMRSANFGCEHLRGLWSAFFYMEDRHNRDHPERDDNDELFKLDKKATNFISSLLSTLQYLFKREESDTESNSNSSQNSIPNSGLDSDIFPRLRDYKIELFNHVNTRSRAETMKLVMSCMNPGLVFEKMKECRTVIVTSGTLSPIKSFASELGIPFQRTMSSKHVLMQDRIYVGVVDSHSAKSKQLKLVSGLYGGQRGQGMRADVGKIILDICKTVPHGILVFVPSKAFLLMLKKHFSKTQILNKITKVKPGGIFWETDLQEQNKRMPEMIAEYVEGAKDKTKGAVLFAYCRGRVSEGVDFTDDQARAVITVGIPNLPPDAEKVTAKKDYNDARCIAGLDTFTGRNWYESSAYRALNQAFGRCIRHSKDWGVICMIDSRLRHDQRHLSAWVTGGITGEQMGNMEKLLPQIRQFVWRLTAR